MKLTDRIRILIESVTLYMICALGLLYYLSPLEGLPVMDGLFHYRVAENIANGNHLWFSIPWLPHTILGPDGPDHHWLWHLLISPFTQLPFNDWYNLKVAIAFSAALIPAFLNFIGRLLGIPLTPLFSIAACVAGYMLPGRYLMLKSQTIAVILLTAYIYFAVKDRYKLTAVTAFIFMNSYHGALILLPVSAIITFVIWATEKKINHQLLTYTTLGLLTGLIINPWYPDTVNYLLFHVFNKMLNPIDGLGVGSEWLATPAHAYFEYAWIANISLLAAVTSITIMFFRNRALINRTELCLIAIALFTAILYKFANRFVEYYGPIAVLAGAYPCRHYLTSFARKSAATALLIPIIGYSIDFNFSVVSSSLISSNQHHRELHQFLSEYAEPEDMIFDAAWGNFPLHIWQSNNYRYINGLDPHYLAYQDPAMFKAWRAIRHNRLPNTDDLGKLIYQTFQCDWVLISPDSINYIQALKESPNASLAHDSNSGLLFRITGKNSP